MNTIEIPLSKWHLLFSIGGSILFVVLGFHLFTTTAARPGMTYPSLVKGVSIVTILFFSTTCIYATTKLFNSKPGMIIDNNGIIDNTNASSIGLIKWADITAIKTQQFRGTKFLLVYTNDPQKTLENVKGIKLKLMKATMKRFGTPLAIASTTLNYNFNTLETLLQQRFNEQPIH